MPPTVEQLRVLLSDPSVLDGPTIFPDEHYEILCSVEPNVYRAAANGARTLAAYFAQKVAVTAGPVKIESSDKCEHYLKIAAQYDAIGKTQAPPEPGSSLFPVLGGPVSGGAVTGSSLSEMDDMASDPDRYGSAFYRGLDDDPSSGGEG